MWVMLTKKLPTEVSPPAMAIFWAIPWPLIGKPFDGLDSIRRKTAMGIIFYGEKIRIFSEEYVKVTEERMEEYCHPAKGSHDLIEQNNETLDQVPCTWETKEQKQIYEAALLDGCTPGEAMRIMAGLDLDISSFPPIGWYRVKSRIGRNFFTKEELEITLRRIND